jgi:hypothetical protein
MFKLFTCSWEQHVLEDQSANIKFLQSNSIEETNELFYK